MPGPSGQLLPMAPPSAAGGAGGAGGDALALPERPSTIGEGGARRWVYTADFRGAWQRRRNLVNLLLVGFFFALPWLQIGGHQAVLFDIPRRKLAFFGLTLWPQDTILFWLLMFSFFVAIFFVTAQWGRLWCGWACPQTVFLEGVFRRVERFFEGDRNQRVKLDAAPWTFAKVRTKALKHAVYLAISAHVANTCICYFVGTDRVLEMTLRPPSENASWFAFMAAVGLVFYGDFAWFREQLCIVACPYGRWQSVLLDEHSLIVGYDRARGEARGTVRQRRDSAAATVAGPTEVAAAAVAGPTAAPVEIATASLAAKRFGDCIDCRRCVDVCPTGIDIRMGLQMECVNCTACIDACDAVMDKVGRPRGLIRYTSLNELEGKPRLLVRGRTIGYAIALVVALGALGLAVAFRAGVEIQVLRGTGRSVQVVQGVAINHLRAKIINKTEVDRAVSVSVRGAEGVTLEVPKNPWPVARGATATMEIFVQREAARMPASGETIRLVFEEGGKVIYEREVRILRH